MPEVHNPITGQPIQCATNLSSTFLHLALTGHQESTDPAIIHAVLRQVIARDVTNL